MMKVLLLLMTTVMLWAGGLRAEMWCGQGAQAALDHPCGSPTKRTAAAAAAKYNSEWTNLVGVDKVEQASSKYGGEEIRVHVDLHFESSSRTGIPASLDGIPVVIFPGFPAGPDLGNPFGSLANTEKARSEQAEREKSEAAEKAYRLVVHKYGDDWLAVPGVLGIGPSSCDANRCDFGAVGIVVQRQLLNLTRSKIPSSVDGVPTILIPQD